MLLWTANQRRMVVGGERLSVRTAREQRGAGVPLPQISLKRLVGSWCAIITECRQVLVNGETGKVQSEQVQGLFRGYPSGRRVTDKTSVLPSPAFEMHAEIVSENSSINARSFES